MTNTFEYKVINLRSTYLEGIHQYFVDEDILNVLADEGWEIFQFFGGQMILKKPKCNHSWILNP